MTAFDQAWGVLKALEEQQAFKRYIRPSGQYGKPGSISQERLRTIHPVILGMMRRNQPRFDTAPDMSLTEESSLAGHGKLPGKLENIPTEFQQGPYYRENVADEASRQFDRGSVFDDANYNVRYVREHPQGLAMVGEPQKRGR